MESSNPYDIHLTAYRWVILAIFCVACNINFMQIPQFTIIANIVIKYYDVHPILVNLTGTFFMSSCVVFSGAANMIINKFSIKVVCLMASGLTTVGAYLKLLVIDPHRFYFALMGQFTCSLGQVLLINIPSQVSSYWFEAEHVSTACSICVFGMQSGLAIGFLLPSIYVPNGDSTDTIEKGMWLMMIVNACINTGVFLLVLIFFRSRPKHPPSLSQAKLEPGKEGSVFQNMKQLMTDSNFMLIAFIFGLSNGCYSFFCITLNEVYMNYFPNSEQDVGRISFISGISGATLGNLIFGYLLDKYHKFRLISFIVIFVPTIVFIGFVFALEYHWKLATYILYPTFGFFLACTLLVGLEFGTEATYPIPEVACCSIVNASIYLFTIIFVLGPGSFIKEIGMIPIHIMITAFLLLTSGLIYFINPTLKRYEANKGI